MQRYLIIRLSALGDVAMVAAILRQAALQYPDREYTLLSKKRMSALLADMPKNVHFVAYGDEPDWSLYDVVLDAHSVWRSLGIDMEARFHGKKVKRIHKPRWKRRLLIRGRKVSVPTMLQLYARLLDLPSFSATDLSAPQIQKSGIGIAPFAAHKGKIYPTEQMEQVVALLSERNQEESIYLFGHGETEKRICEQWAEKYAHVVSLVGKQSLAEELAIIRDLRVMLTMDSGNMHLASLVGTRCISIWGATHPQMGFVGYNQSPADCITLNLPCSPCSAYGNKPCRWGDYRCMKIDPQDIANRLSK